MNTLGYVVLARTHTCVKCDRILLRGSVVVRRTRAPITDAERARIGRHGRFVWYYCAGGCPKEKRC